MCCVSYSTAVTALFVVCSGHDVAKAVSTRIERLADLLASPVKHFAQSILNVKVTIRHLQDFGVTNDLGEDGFVARVLASDEDDHLVFTAMEKGPIL